MVSCQKVSSLQEGTDPTKTQEARKSAVQVLRERNTTSKIATKLKPERIRTSKYSNSFTVKTLLPQIHIRRLQVKEVAWEAARH